MIDFNDETIKNININPDRFGMAAISTIYKAFGDNIRSKEFWPWSERVGDSWQWEKSKGMVADLEYAKDLINYALLRIDVEMVDENTTDVSNSNKLIKELKHRLNKVNKAIDTSKDITEAINDTSDSTTNELNEIENM